MSESSPRFRIGQTRKETEIYLSEQTRFHHICWWGRYPLGKDKALYQLAKQEFKQTSGSATFIVETPLLASLLYALAKEHKRDVIWLNPYVHLGTKNQLMWLDSYDKEKMDSVVLNYEQVIKKGTIVLVDLEPHLYWHQSQQACDLLLWHLQCSLPNLRPVERDGHMIYVENAETFLPSLTFFLKYGSLYRVGVMMWLTSPQQLNPAHPSFLAALEAYVGSHFLYTKYALSDTSYFKLLFSVTAPDFTSALSTCPISGCLYWLTDEWNKIRPGVVSLDVIDEEYWKLQQKNGKTRKTMLHREMVKEEMIMEQQAQKEQQLSNCSAGIEALEEEEVLSLLALPKVETIQPHENSVETEILAAEAYQRHKKELFE